MGEEMIDRAKVVSMRAAGMTFQAIANEFSVTRQRVHQLAAGYRSPRHARILSCQNREARRAAIVLRYANGKPTNAAIASEFGVSKWVVRYALRKAGVSRIAD